MYEIEKILIEIENDNDNSYLQILAIEKQIQALEKGCKCMKLIVNGRKTDIKAKILDIIG